MALTLHAHPLSSYCWKTLIALYEIGIPFENHLVDLGDAEARSQFLSLSPLGKMPALVDAGRGRTLYESSIVIEYVCLHYGGGLIPADPDTALQVRLLDRLFDLYVQTPMQRAVAENFRPQDGKDPFGVAQAKRQLRAAYDMLEQMLHDGGWAVGDSFSMADCAACPALFYGDKIEPIGARPKLAAYLQRLKDRPSFARVLDEAKPYFAMFPGG